MEPDGCLNFMHLVVLESKRKQINDREKQLL